MENSANTTAESFLRAAHSFVPATVASATIAHQLRNLLMNTHRYFGLLNSSIHLIYNQTLMLIKEVTELAKEVNMDDASLVRLVHYSLHSISHLVTNLQYQDLIRQKLEHNQQLNEKALAWMQEASRVASPISLEERLSLLPLLIKLQSAQLDYADGEYQKAFRRMRASLEEFGENTQDVGTLVDTVIDHLVDADNEAATNRANTIHILVQQIALEVSGLLNETNEAHVFTETVKNIKAQWQKLIAHLAIPTLPYSTSDLALLEQLEALYTMETERHIFRQIFFPKGASGPIVTNEGEVELF